MSRLSIQAACITAVLTLPSLPAMAEICLYEDADGHTTYSNVTESPPKGAKKIRCFSEPKRPKAESAASPTPAAKPASGAQDSTAFPKIDRTTQRKRDDGRRKILEDELASELQQLEQAKNALSAQESTRAAGDQDPQRFLDRTQPYRDAVENHERNIEAIQREIANMR